MTEQATSNKYVLYSTNVKNSSYVQSSTNITNCQTVSNSNFCTNGKYIFNSQFITDSDYLINSENCSSSTNIVYSNNVINSKDIYQSFNVVNGQQLVECDNCEDTNFSYYSSNLQHCFFCVGLHDKQYHIFNQPFNPQLENVILAGYAQIQPSLQFVEDWGAIDLFSTWTPTVIMKSRFGELLTNNFFNWLTTLPNFNSQLGYILTQNSFFR